MKVTDSQQRGNWGEQFIAEQLTSQGCFVRHVTQGHDSGVDLYCESVEHGIPFLHFWCQIKTSKNYNRKREKMSIKPRLNHREYWLKQPVPVYIFMVPDARPAASFPYFICRAFDFHNGDTITSFRKVSNQSDLSLFLKENLPFDTYLWGIQIG